MPERLTPLDVSLLAADSGRPPSSVGTVAVFDRRGPDDADRLVALIEQRLSFVPRYRQRVSTVPLRLASPVWIDDDAFDLDRHVRRVTVAAPGTLEQLRDLVARVLARRLDRARPLWALYLVEGLEDDRFALVTTAHLSLVDGIDTVDLLQVLLDVRADSTESPASAWLPRPGPTAAELLVGAVWEAAQDPVVAVRNVRGLLGGALEVARAVGGAAGEALAELADEPGRGSGPPAGSPFGDAAAEPRRVALLSVPLAELHAVHAAHAVSVHDVVLAVLTGGLRSWLLSRGEVVTTDTVVTAVVPVSVPEDLDAPTSLGSSVAPHVQPLPVGQPDALERLRQVAAGRRTGTDRAVSAQALTELAGFAPPTLHALGGRAAAAVNVPHDLVVANVPGPQQPLYAAGARLVASYPVPPLPSGLPLAVGVTSYDAQLHVGLTGRESLGDLNVLRRGLRDALDELLATVGTDATGPGRRAAEPEA